MHILLLPASALNARQGVYHQYQSPTQVTLKRLTRVCTVLASLAVAANRRSRRRVLAGGLAAGADGRRCNIYTHFITTTLCKFLHLYIPK